MEGIIRDVFLASSSVRMRSWEPAEQRPASGREREEEYGVAGTELGHPCRHHRLARQINAQDIWRSLEFGLWSAHEERFTLHRAARN